MANLHWVVLSMAISAILVNVDCNCVTPLKSTAVDSGCAIYLEDPSVADQRLCGNIDGPAAQRACWDLSKGVSTTRQFRCIPMTGGSLDTINSADTYTHVTGGQIGFGCATPAVDCFLGCYTSATVATATPATCSGAQTDMAIGCVDIDECVDGAYINCNGPFDEDCEHVPACGPNAVCENIDRAATANLGVGRGWTCTCTTAANPGEGRWSGNGYDLETGCVDVDECEGSVCTGAVCQNTPGSYICVCEAGHWDEVDEVCDVSPCDEFELRTMENSNGWEGDMDIHDYEEGLTSTCEEGFEPRASDMIRSTCRYDGSWCQCDSVDCKRKKCDVPNMDGNAVTSAVDGVTLDTIEYSCLEGFKAKSGDSYELDCHNDGTWETLADPDDDGCIDVNECDYKVWDGDDTCPENSDCVNTVGSYHCICHYGYEGAMCETKISCGDIPRVEHAERITHVSATEGRYEMVVSYRCDDGYHVSTELTHYRKVQEFDITCKVTKCWNPDPTPECVPIYCGDPGIIKHAGREGHSFYYDSEVIYTCYKGFRRSDYDTYNSALYYGVIIKITCEEKGWSSKAHCVDVDECKELEHPCGYSLGHLCVNTEGGFTCSCADGYRLDSTGQHCILHPHQQEEMERTINPCDVYHAYGLCHDGRCQFNGYGVPECLCNPGFIGAFCDRQDESDFTIPFVLSVVGIVIGGIVLLMSLVLACCVLTKHCYTGHHDDDRDSAVYAHHAHKVQHQPAGSHGQSMFRSVMSGRIPCLDF